MFFTHRMEKREKKNRYTLEEATQFVLDLPSDSQNSDFDDLCDEENFGP